MAKLLVAYLFKWQEVEAKSDLERLRLVLSHLPDEALMKKLEAHRDKGRDDYPIRPVWNSVLAGIVYQHEIADRLKEYITRKGIGSDQRIFPISYTAGREVVNKAGKVVGIHLKPHDLRRHAATYASRSGVPIEIVSKVIRRHANLSTTQRYLGTVSDVEAMRWIDNLYGSRIKKG
jgi:integrase